MCFFSVLFFVRLDLCLVYGRSGINNKVLRFVYIMLGILNIFK